MNKYFLILFCIILFWANESTAQINAHGIPFHKVYTENNYGDLGQVWAIEKGADDIMYFGCNYGIKTYDGVNWKSYGNANSTIIRSLQADQDGNIYYGAESDFGILRTDEKGNLEFYSLYLNYYNNQSPDFSSVWKTLIADNQIFFQAAEKIFYTDLPLRFDKTDSLLNEIKVIQAKITPFHNSFVVDNMYFVRQWEKGLCKFQNDSLLTIPGGKDFGLKRIYVMQPYNKSEILIGTRNSGFFIYSTKTNLIEPFNLGNINFITESVLYTSTKIDSEHFALGTFENGVIIINNSGTITQILNKNTCQTDNKVLSIFYDESSENLWYANTGITKANIANSFTQWTEQSGISGTPSDAIRFKNKLYVSTDNGLYQLNENKDSIAYFTRTASLIEARRFLKYSKTENGEEQLWISSKEGIFQITENNQLKQIADIKAARILTQSTKNINQIYVGSPDGLNLFTFNKDKLTGVQNHDHIEKQIISILETPNHLLLGTSSSGVLTLKNFEDSAVQAIASTNGLPLVGKDFLLHTINNKSIISCGKGLFEIKFENDSAFAAPFNYFGKLYGNSTKGVYKITETKNSYWLSVYENLGNNVNHKIIRVFKDDELSKDTIFAAMLPRKASLFFYNDGKYIWTGNEKGLFKYNPEKSKGSQESFHTLIRKVSVTKDSLLFGGYNFSSVNNLNNNRHVLDYFYNDIYFEFATPYYTKEENTEYCFRLKGDNSKWSSWTKETKRRFTNLPEGDYTFEVKAKNIYNTESSTASFSFSILPPWYRTVWAYITYIVIASLLVWLIVKLYTRKLRRENEILEDKVQERTTEVREKNVQLQQHNEEILAQRDEIETQRDELEVQRDHIVEQQESIMDSIRYASRIQNAVMPPEMFLNDILGEHFVLFRPRDVVSGDFYWATQIDNKTVIVAADCTGHGVPGAFMSMLGISFLNEVVNKDQNLQANVILNKLRDNVKSALRQKGKDGDTKDGMDIALLIIDRENMKMQFAGAYNPLYLIRDGEVIRYKADRMPIGIYIREKDEFTNNLIDIQKGDAMYIFSDGYVDQFGGEAGRKLKSKKFKELLLDVHQSPFEQQDKVLNKFIEKWMEFNPDTGQPYEQIDDILIVGVKI
ncbi:MAG: SpoIIE family protein phosphatase [Bacteroidota bacterium]|nr:SpoIIE family protein phosphatase [Bacteroidota bacterium]